MQMKKLLDFQTYSRLWVNKNMKQAWLTEIYLEMIQLNPKRPIDYFVELELNGNMVARR